MSPLRQWMTMHRMPAWYSWVVVVMVPVMASVGVLVLSLKINERSIDRERSARLASEAARQASERALCEVFVVLDDAYARAKPTSPASRELAQAIANVRITNHCPPRVPSK